METDIIDPAHLFSQAEKLRQRASKGASVRHTSGTYTLQWDGDMYRTICPDGADGPRWNTRKVTEAKRWLIFWLNN